MAEFQQPSFKGISRRGARVSSSGTIQSVLFFYSRPLPGLPRRQVECPLSHAFPLLIPPFLRRWRVGGVVIGLDKNRPGSLLRDNTLIPLRVSIPTAPCLAASPSEKLSKRTVTPHSAASRIHLSPSAAAWPSLSRPAPLGQALFPYKADHQVGQARPLPNDVLRGSPVRGLWTPASPIPQPRSPAPARASGPPGGARASPQLLAPSPL